MSYKTFFIFILVSLGTMNVSSSTPVPPTTLEALTPQEKHDKLVMLRIEYIKENVSLSQEEEKKLSTALMALDKNRYIIWKQSVELRKSIDTAKNLSEEEANTQLEKLLVLDKKLEQAHVKFYNELKTLGFSAEKRLKLYVTLKNFRRKIGKSIRI